MDKYAILLATYNGEDYIVEMLDSLERQTNRDFKCYIHDDGSYDNTIPLIKEWIRDKENYEILEYEYDSDAKEAGSGHVKNGAKNNFMSMLGRVEAEYYMFADQDDVWKEDKVSKLIDEIERVTRDREDVPTAVHCDMYVVDEDLNVITDSFIKHIGRDIYRNRLPQLLIDNPAAGCTMIINKALRDKALHYNNIDNIPMHDQWLMCVASATGKISVLDEPLLYYRQHLDNVMGAESESKADKVIRNAKDIVTGELLREKKEFHEKEVNLAKELMYVPGIDNRTRKFLIDLTRIGERNKIERMEFYRKNGLDRKEHSLWMRLWV